MNKESNLQLLVKDLRPALTGLAKVITGKPTLPVLGCVKIQPHPTSSTVTLTGTDPDTRLALELPAKVETRGKPFLVPLSDLRQAVKGGSTNDRLSLQPEDEDRVTVIREAGATRIPQTITSLSLDEFPDNHAVKGTPFDLDKGARDALLQAMACSSSDATRYVLNGALLDGGHSVIGTDGRHLFRSNSMDLPMKASVILPHRKVLDWKFLQASPNWTLAIDEDWFQLAGEGWALTSRLIEGNYPNWKQVLPQDENFRSSVTFPENTLDQLARTIGSLPGAKASNKPVGLRLDDKGVTLLARGDDDEATMTEVPLAEAETSGPAVTVFVNRDFLVKALRFDLNRVDIIDATSPVRLRQGTSSSRDMIIMPVRVIDTPTPTPAAKSTRKPQPQTKPTPMKNNSNNGGTNGRHKPTETEAASPLDTAATHIATAKDQLKQAVSSLSELATALKQAKADQKTKEKEIRQVRSTIRTLQKVEL